ncbi:MAG: riboflavin synthase [Actinomycetaceae bacterium]|nr:riboflavin synthase [Actinomycetaceae bacterium]
MFTGIIEEVGTVRGIHLKGNSGYIDINATHILTDTTKLGDSIAVNGVCLTITSLSSNSFTADVMPETLQRSNLGSLTHGSKVNLERAMSAQSRFDGHIVAGHVDSTGTISSLTPTGNATTVTIEADEETLLGIVPKGSITIDGISLTVIDVTHTSFSVSIIPFTSEETTLTHKKVGDIVNLETDIIGKYVTRLLNTRSSSSSSATSAITSEFLREHGF